MEHTIELTEEKSEFEHFHEINLCKILTFKYWNFCSVNCDMPHKCLYNLPSLHVACFKAETTFPKLQKLNNLIMISYFMAALTNTRCPKSTVYPQVSPI